MSRQGKHKEGKSIVAFFADVEFRALLLYIVDLSGETATDIMMDGIKAKATQLGVLENGKVLPKHKAAIDLIAESIKAKALARKHNNKRNKA